MGGSSKSLRIVQYSTVLDDSDSVGRLGKQGRDAFKGVLSWFKSSAASMIVIEISRFLHKPGYGTVMASK